MTILSEIKGILISICSISMKTLSAGKKMSCSQKIEGLLVKKRSRIRFERLIDYVFDLR